MMFVFKTKKYAFTGLGLTLLSFLLLVLSGCDATSDPRQSYQATGAWQGTIGTDQVRGIIAPDGRYHLAIVDASGAFHPEAGEYIGGNIFIDPDNIGSMTLTRLQPPENAGAQQQVKFKLSADRLYSVSPPIELSRTPEANGPADQSDVAGRWSLSSGDNITAVLVDAAGILSGGDGVNCKYEGTLQLLTPSWNIYRLDLTLSDYTYLSCPLNTESYSGLAMRLHPDDPRPTLWFATNRQAKTFVGEWSKTINVAPVAQMTILGERVDQSVLVKEGNAVELDAQDSSDTNHDRLTYVWSGTDPDGNALTMTVAQDTSAATFLPLSQGLYALSLTVSDGIVSDTLDRQLRVEWTPDRFVGCGNGTVLDTKSNLLWLQDAGCVALNQEIIWGVSHAVAQERVGTLLASGVCNLGDNSVAGDWRLPTLNDFSLLVPQSQWSDGNLFLNVGTNPDPVGSNLPLYWTAEPDPEVANNWFYVNIGYSDPSGWFGSYFENNATAVWPVRALRSGEQCPPVP